MVNKIDCRRITLKAAPRGNSQTRPARSSTLWRCSITRLKSPQSLTEPSPPFLLTPAMRRLLQLLGITTTILTGFVFPTHSQDLVRVTHDRVNVRGGPSVNSEVIIHLQKDEQVAVVEIVRTNSAAVGENGDWAKIRLPSDTPVWVYAPFVDAKGRVVRSERLNVRAGPGLNFSILGSLAKGAPISSIRTLDDWMEIEAPTNTFAFANHPR